MDKPIEGSGLSWGTVGNTIDERIRTYNRLQDIIKSKSDKRGLEIAPNRSIQQIQLGREFYKK